MEKDYRIDLREVLLGRPTRLRYIVRFSICPRTHDESVAEHSFYTAFIALMIARSLGYRVEGSNGRDSHMIDVGLLLSRALMHDMDESYSGDFIRMFKHSNPQLKEQIDQACIGFMTKLAMEISRDPGEGGDLLQMWEDAKADDYEGMIVGVADFMSVVSYVVQEIKAGNHNMFEHLEDLKKFHRTFDSLKYEFIRGHIQECGKILDSVHAKRVEIS